MFAGVTVGVCAPSGRGQHGGDDDHAGAETRGEAAPGKDDRTNESAMPRAGAAQPGKPCRSSPLSRRPAENHPAAAWVNRDASLFLARPDNGPSGRHGSGGRETTPDSAERPLAGTADARAGRSRRYSRPGRGRNSGRSPPGSGRPDTGTTGPRPIPSVLCRRRGVDERRLRPDSDPAFVPGTVWGTAPMQNRQVTVGAVFALKSGTHPACCRDHGPILIPIPGTAAVTPRLTWADGARGVAPTRVGPRQAPLLGLAPAPFMRGFSPPLTTPARSCRHGRAASRPTACRHRSSPSCW